MTPKSFRALVLLALCALPLRSQAEPLRLGVGFDAGVPDGVALGAVTRPTVDWLRIELAASYNGLAPGGRIGVTLEPIPFLVEPTFTVEGGFAASGRIPTTSNTPRLSYQYVNLHLGIEVGDPEKVRVFLHAGPSYVHISSGGFQDLVGQDFTAADPTAKAWLVPTAKLGFVWTFFGV